MFYIQLDILKNYKSNKHRPVSQCGGMLNKSEKLLGNPSVFYAAQRPSDGLKKGLTDPFLYLKTNSRTCDFDALTLTRNIRLLNGSKK